MAKAKAGKNKTNKNELVSLFIWQLFQPRF
jgi:hypothetical protein